MTPSTNNSSNNSQAENTPTPSEIKKRVICVPAWEFPSTRFEVEIISKLNYGFLSVRRKDTGALNTIHRANLIVEEY